MNCDGLRLEGKGRINRREQVSEIDATDAAFTSTHCIACMVYGIRVVSAPMTQKQSLSV